MKENIIICDSLKLPRFLGLKFLDEPLKYLIPKNVNVL